MTEPTRPIATIELHLPRAYTVQSITVEGDRVVITPCEQRKHRSLGVCDVVVNYADGTRRAARCAVRTLDGKISTTELR